MICRRFYISGRVQSVWFRESTRAQAEKRGITGHALNLTDGRVEVLACGEADALDQLATWLGKGPPLAKVVSVEVEAADVEVISGFLTG